MINDYYLVIILFGFIVAGLSIQKTLFVYLRNKHPQTWKDIGAHSMLVSKSIKNELSLTKFLWRKGYLKLKDPIINRIMYIFLGYLVIFFIAFVLLLIYEYFITGRLKNSLSVFL